MDTVVKTSRLGGGGVATLHLSALGGCFVSLAFLVFLSCLQLCTSAGGEILWEDLSRRERGLQIEDSHSDTTAAASTGQKYGTTFKHELPEAVIADTVLQTVLAIGRGSNKLALQPPQLDAHGGPVRAPSTSDLEIDAEDSRIRHSSRSLLQEDFGAADALLLFKAGIKNWTEGALDGWTSENRSSYCSWTRVTCNDELHVISLNFSGLLMNGTLGPSLAKLVYLEDLDLSHNFLLSSLPQEWGELQKLQTLILHDNYLFGGIPAEYGNMSSLRTLYIGVQGWFFNGSIPEELGLLSNLEVLALGTLYNYDLNQDYHNYRSNKMIGHIPKSISNCTKLRYLDFYGNDNLTGPIPEEYGKLINLEYLSFEQNNFTGSIPSELGNLTKLLFLHFGNNRLSGEVPVSFARLSEVQLLNVGTNELTGNFIGVNSTSWNKLVALLLDGNRFTGGFPPVLTTLTRVVQLYMFNNEFTGSLPRNLGALSKLKSFIFRSNQFDGELPESFNNCTNLVTLDAANNQFKGTLDPIRNLSQLRYLNLGSSYSSKNISWESLRGFEPSNVLNSFTGPLTDEMLAHWPLLHHLYLDNNDFYGTIPKALANLTDLIHLLLNNNQFEGTIPVELGRLSNLEILYLQVNHLTGSIPVSLTNLTNARDLNLGNNSFTGPVPPEFGSLENLQYLRLYRNNLTGAIPPEIGRLQKLLYLILYENQLTGTIPPALANCSALQNLRLSNNSLTGTITDINFLQLQNLTSFSVNVNNLTGGFPKTISNCTKLELLDLSFNQFSGELPNYEGQLSLVLPALRVLELANNTFSGTIPLWIWHLSNLQVLDLSSNLFTGSLPSDLSGLEGFYRYNPLTHSPDQTPDGGPKQAAGPGRRLFEQVLIRVRGQVYEYLLETLISVDLSVNQLSGQLPDELGNLQLLLFLNLARNNFSGKIPEKLGNIKELQSLELSSNGLTGSIPAGLTKLSLLSYLNVSYNALEGRIPSSDVFDTRFAESSYKPGNDGLCGRPLQTLCADTTNSGSYNGSHSSPSSSLFDHTFMLAFQIGVAIGLGIVLVPLSVIPSLRGLVLTEKRHAYRWNPRLIYGLYRTP